MRRRPRHNLEISRRHRSADVGRQYLIVKLMRRRMSISFARVFGQLEAPPDTCLRVIKR